MDYKEMNAIGIVRLMLTDGVITEEIAGKYFPELKESEDERIRKGIISAIKEDWPGHTDWIAWLEKQGEHANFRNKIQIGDKVTRNKDGVLVNLSKLKRIAKPAEEYNITGIGSKNAQGKLGEMIKNLKPVNEVLEQKPDWSEKHIADVFEKVGLAKIAREQSNDSLTNALQDAMIELSKFLPQQNFAWSKEDKKIWEEISDMLWEGYRQSCSKFTWDNIRDWIKPKIEYFKGRTQPKQEWSEEDERIKNNLLSELTNLSVRKLIEKETEKKYASWLKSLRPQNTWKPSEEQIKALERECMAHSNYDLCRLCEQLKKLREEDV